MTLTVVSVAYPFARLTTDSAGGAEQVLVNMDRALMQSGHRSFVIAAAGSQVCGELIPVGLHSPILGEAIRRNTQVAVRRALAQLCETEPVDVVHQHGCDFFEYMPPEQVPTLVTLHMPLASYPPRALQMRRPHLWFNPVSCAQARKAWSGVNLLPPIENGVAVDTFQSASGEAKSNFAMAFGRVCPEKGFHLAIDACVRAKTPLVLAGITYPWPEHVRYFDQELAPRLDDTRRWIGQIHGERKRHLLSAARCLLIPSLIEETSSLVAMEALAAGTPVIAFPVGALPEIIEHGVTGYIVKDVDEMAEAIRRVDSLEPGVCRRIARQRFELTRSTNAYLDLYREIAAHKLRGRSAPRKSPLQAPVCRASS